MITGAVYFVGAIAFILFGSGETQPWATQKSSNKLNDIPINLLINVESLKS